MLPRAGDVLHVGQAASVQFGGGRHFLFRVIRVMERETSNTYSDWAWLDGYQLNADGDAIDRREIYVKPAGLRHVDVAFTRPTRKPRVPRPRTKPATTTTGSTRCP